MRKTVKRILAAAVVLLVAGAALAAVGFVMGGMKSVQLGPGGFYIADEANRLDVSKDFQTFDALDVEVSACEIVLKEGDGYHVEIRNMGARPPVVSLEDGVLTIRETPGLFSWTLPGNGSFGWWMADAPHIEIGYPEGASLGAVKLAASASDIRIKNLRADTLKVFCGAGSLKAESMAVSGLTVDMSAGNCDLSDVSAGRAELSLSMGDLRARRFVCDALEGHMDAGSTDIEGTLRGSTRISASMGDVTLKTGLPESEYSYDLDVSMGNVAVNGNRLSNGGRLSDWNADAPNRIEVDASMGSVSVEFAE
ncbi:MAG: DUF4097 domain-containing protein [Clostridiales Family XIII bacterium]|nr:DUF4097 domain-containing protein [Clostridiales Family XIII bacterium]